MIAKVNVEVKLQTVVVPAISIFMRLNHTISPVHTVGDAAAGGCLGSPAEGADGKRPRPPGRSTAALTKRLIKGQLCTGAWPYSHDSDRVDAKPREHGQGKPGLRLPAARKAAQGDVRNLSRATEAAGEKPRKGRRRHALAHVVRSQPYRPAGRHHRARQKTPRDMASEPG